MFTLDPNAIFIDLLVSCIGLGLFMYGKRADRWPQMIAGGLLMGYPYVISGVAAMLATGAVILAGLGAALWLGW
jgi:predicted phage tail protein